MAIKTILKQLLNVNGVKINTLDFEITTSSLYIRMEPTKGRRKRCPICGKKCPRYDTRTSARKWRTLDFGSCTVYSISAVYRIECEEHGVHTEQVPWAFHNSRFTKEFEAQVAYLAVHMNKKEVSQLMRIAWNTVGPILSRTNQRLEPDRRIRFQNLKRIGIDETSYRKGHKYVTVVVDHDTNQVIWVGTDTGKDVLTAFMKELTMEQRQAITLVSADGARWIKAVVSEQLPNAELCIDGFHVVTWAMEAMDESRTTLWREYAISLKKEPTRTRGRPKKEEVVKSKKNPNGRNMNYTLGKNPENLSEYQHSCLNEVRNYYPKLFNAYQLKEGLRKVFQCEPSQVEVELKRWLSWACRCRIPDFVALSKTIRRHYKGSLATVKHALSNARIESMNNKIKVLIRKSYGFRNIQNLKDMIMIVCSNLVHSIQLPHQSRKLTHTN